MTTSEIIIIVALAVSAVMLVTAYITLIVTWRYARHIERKYLGEPEEYMGKETENGQRTGNLQSPKNEESLLRYSCKRDKGSWLLSLSSPKPHRANDKNPKVTR